MLDLGQAVVNGLLIGSVFALVAVGLTLIYGVMDIVNFAHGELMMVGMYTTFFGWSLWGIDPLLMVPVAIVTVAVTALVAYWLAVRPVLGKSMLSQIMVTFGLLVALRGGAQYLFTPNTRSVRDPLVGDTKLKIGDVIIGGPQLVAALGALALTLGMQAFIRRTETGAALVAAGEDAGAASLLGIDTNRMFALAWVIGGATTGAAGALLMNSFSVTPEAGATFGLVAFVTVALGGFGSITGAGFAGLALGVVQSVVGLYFSAYSLAAILGLYLVVVFIRPQGLGGIK